MIVRGQQRPTGKSSSDLKTNDNRDQWLKEYSKYLNTGEWKTIRNLVLSRDNYTCLECGAHQINGDSSIETRFLQASHIHGSYTNFFQAESIDEKLTYLRTLCVKCHRKYDKQGSYSHTERQLLVDKFIKQQKEYHGYSDATAYLADTKIRYVGDCDGDLIGFNMSSEPRPLLVRKPVESGWWFNSDVLVIIVKSKEFGNAIFQTLLGAINHSIKLDQIENLNIPTATIRKWAISEQLTFHRRPISVKGKLPKYVAEKYYNTLVDNSRYLCSAEYMSKLDWMECL